MSQLDIRPLHPLFVGEVAGVDCTAPTTDTLVDAIHAGMDEYAILVFRGPILSPEQQMSFTRALGPLDIGFAKIALPGSYRSRFTDEALADMSNVGPDGKVFDRGHRRIIGNIANQLWHSDSSFQNPSARYSLLHAVVCPEEGGQTEFADMRSAYDGMSASLKERLEGLEAEHHALHSRLMLGDTSYSEEQINKIPPARWPLVRTHPGSGRRHLFIGAHCREVVGMNVAEGRMLLQDLLEHATQPEFVYRHEWNVGDVVMWDNRCTLHRGRSWDLSKPRELRRSTTLNLEPSVAELA
jgi:alpha-ketoglutarate-dependent 2,4-dichlorophenoxyacetate dioxygenase